MQIFVDRLTQQSGLGDAERAALLRVECHETRAPANTDVVRSGETVPQHACLIVDGLLARFGQVVDGSRQIIALQVAGDICHLHCVISPRSNWALQALSNTRMLRIPLHALRQAAQAYPAIAQAFWRDCAIDASILSQWVVNLGRRDALSRLAHLLCELALRVERARIGSRQAFRIDASQAQFGDALGLTAVHVNRTFRTLRAEGLVATRGRLIQIREWDRLAALADFDRAYLHLDNSTHQREARRVA